LVFMHLQSDMTKRKNIKTQTLTNLQIIKIPLSIKVCQSKGTNANTTTAREEAMREVKGKIITFKNQKYSTVSSGASRCIRC
jgi:hypothetical protein